MKRNIVLCVILLSAQSIALPASASMESLSYFEANITGGYSSSLGWKTFSSQSMDVMQKTSAGFEDFRRFSGDAGDFLVTDLQCRLAYDNIDQTKPLEFQVYNAYLRFKKIFFGSDLWAGHFKVPFGNAWLLDDHSHLLYSLQMQSLGFDRDWGAGVIGSTRIMDYALGVTLGSGMGAYARGNYLVSGRMGFGDFSSDNYSIGVSVAGGMALPVMGYSRLSDTPVQVLAAALDATYLAGPFSLKVEIDYGTWSGIPSGGMWLRLGYVPPALQELSIELEPRLWFGDFSAQPDAQAGLCVSYKFSQSVTARAAYFYKESLTEGEENSGVIQLYLFPKIF